MNHKPLEPNLEDLILIDENETSIAIRQLSQGKAASIDGISDIIWNKQELKKIFLSLI